jgi:CubicO group peptidase (beta-lactamase class C family)
MLHPALRASLVAPIVLLAGCKETPLHPRTDARPDADVRAVAVQLRTSAALPAVAVAAIRSEGIRTGVDGVLRHGVTHPVRGGSRFHLGSNTKAITATMIASLVEEGKLTWQSRPADLFPELAAGMHPQYRTVTLEQLLTHRAAVQAFTQLAELATLPDFAGTARQKRDAFNAWLVARAPAGPAGEFLYSNAGYVIAAAMAERAAGRSWEELVRTRVFDPLRLRSAAFGWPLGAGPAEPWGHVWNGTALVPHDPADGFEASLIGPAADITMSVEDYARFVHEHLRGLRGQGTLLRDSTFRRLHTPVGDYAFGWSREVHGGSTIMGHAGSVGTFYAVALIDEARDRAAVVLASAGGPQAEQGAVVAAFQLLGTP